MKKIIFLISAIATAVILTGLLPKPDCFAGPTKVWVPEHKIRTGYVIPGHWRPSTNPGFVWVEGKSIGNVWVAGHWVPVGAAPADKIWATGYWQNGKWHAGHWVPKEKGTWIPGQHSRGGKWIPGHYK